MPARSGTCRSAIALVRVNRGSTWISCAPLALGLHHPLEAHRVALGHVRADDRRCSRRWRGPAGRWWHRRARTRSPDRGPWRSVICGPGSRSDTAPSAREELLDEVVLLVVERRAAEVGEALRAPQDLPVRARVLPRGVAGGDQPVGDHVHRRSRGRGPPTPCRAAGGTGRAVSRRGCSSPAGARPSPLGTAGRGRSATSGSPSIWVTCSSLTKTCWPQPTAQYGHTELTTRSAPAVRATSSAERAERAARPSPSGSEATCLTSGSRSESSRSRPMAQAAGSSSTLRTSRPRSSTTTPSCPGIVPGFIPPSCHGRSGDPSRRSHSMSGG